MIKQTFNYITCEHSISARLVFCFSVEMGTEITNACELALLTKFGLCYSCYKKENTPRIATILYALQWSTNSSQCAWAQLSRELIDYVIEYSEPKVNVTVANYLKRIYRYDIFNMFHGISEDTIYDLSSYFEASHGSIRKLITVDHMDFSKVSGTIVYYPKMTVSVRFAGHVGKRLNLYIAITDHLQTTRRFSVPPLDWSDIKVPVTIDTDIGYPSPYFSQFPLPWCNKTNRFFKNAYQAFEDTLEFLKHVQSLQ